MSLKVMSMVWESSLRSDLRLVALALADTAHDDGRSIYLGQTTVAKKVGKTDRAVRSSFRDLMAMGILEDDPWAENDPERRVTKRYRLNLDRLLGIGDGEPGTVSGAAIEHDAPETTSTPTPETPSGTDRKQLPPPPEADFHPDRKPTSGATGSPLPTNRPGTVREPSSNRRARREPPEPNPVMTALVAEWERWSGPVTHRASEDIDRLVCAGATLADIAEAHAAIAGWVTPPRAPGKALFAALRERVKSREHAAAAGAGEFEGAPDDAVLPSPDDEAMIREQRAAAERERGPILTRRR